MRTPCQERTVLAQGQEITYHLEYKPVKNLNLRVRRDGSVYVSASRAVSVARIDAFVAEHGQRILTAKARLMRQTERAPRVKRCVDGEVFYILGTPLLLHVIRSEQETVRREGTQLLLMVRDPENTRRKQSLVKRFLDQECMKVFGRVLQEQYPLLQGYGVSLPQLRIRDMKSCWGSCLTQKEIITINKRLLQAPVACIEYVVLHELCHLIYPNHSRQFYGLLGEFMPDWTERKALLRQGETLWL